MLASLVQQQGCQKKGMEDAWHILTPMTMMLRATSEMKNEAPMAYII